MTLRKLSMLGADERERTASVEHEVTCQARGGRETEGSADLVYQPGLFKHPLAFCNVFGDLKEKIGDERCLARNGGAYGRVRASSDGNQAEVCGESETIIMDEAKDKKSEPATA